MSNELVIRRARAEDRAAVFAMVANVWEGNDYIPQSWDEWLHDRYGPLLVGELGGRLATLAKLTDLGNREDWFEGLRVAEDQRGKGLARVMLRRCIELSRERGARVLRYSTSEHNQTMQRVAGEFGFRLCYTPEWYQAGAIIAPRELRTLTVERLPGLLADLELSALLPLSSGLYSYDWASFELTPERLRAHLEKGEVVGLGGAAWAMVPLDGRGGHYLAHVEGPPDELTALFRAVRHAAEPHEGAYVRAQLPPDAPILPALHAAGFTSENHRTFVYELVL